MAKKVLIISASPRRGGNSDTLCDRFMQGATEAGHEVEKPRLSEYKINYCPGCGACNSGKPCPLQDDAAAVIDRMVNADVIVLATPVYFYTMNAQMKTLIDRSCARYTEIRDKEFYFIGAMAENDRTEMERTFESLRGFTACLDNAQEKGIVAATGVWESGAIKGTRFMQEAFDMGRRV